MLFKIKIEKTPAFTSIHRGGVFICISGSYTAIHCFIFTVFTSFKAYYLYL